MTSKIIKKPFVHMMQSEDVTGSPDYERILINMQVSAVYALNILHNMASYLQQQLEVLKIPMTVLAMDTIGHLPIPFKGNRWALTVICLHTSYMSAENVVQAYLSGILILTKKGGSVAILSDNGTEFKNKVLNKGM